MTTWFTSLLALVQAVLGVRVVWRLLCTGDDTPICAVPEGTVDVGVVSVIIPVLDEVGRLATCLNGTIQLGPEVGEILVVDSGSQDDTCDVVRQYARVDPRIRLIQAGAARQDWNGKVWGLLHGERSLRSNSEWLLTLDADVAPKASVAAALVAHARQRGLRLLSVAAQQHVPGVVQGVLHPAMLASLVYRFGRPNGATSNSSEALANGQCCLIQRDLLRRLGGFEALRGSLCEDITLARLAARAGERVGFYETDGLVEVSMFSDWGDAWRNWPRSLAMRDALFGIAGWWGLLEVLLVEALPLPILLLGPHGTLRHVNLWLLAMRIGMLCGIARAYPRRQWSFWLSALADLPVALALWRSALAPRHTWRGRTYARKKGSIVAA